jgi:signal transduction histidine kinase
MEQLTDTHLSLARLWRNPSVRRLVLILSVLLVGLALFIGFYSSYSTERLKLDWLEKEAAMLGSLSKEDPALADKWLTLLVQSNKPSPEHIAAGTEWMERSGITHQLESDLLPLLAEYRSRTFWSLLGAAMALFVLMGWLLLRESRKQLDEVRTLALSLEDTVKYNKPLIHRIYNEGELGLLATGAQELTIRLRETIEQLHLDKAFLKDTVADISHQLKTPLASLMIYIDLLQEGKVDNNHATEFLKTCRRELDRMEWLTLTLLKLARLEADALEMSMKDSPLLDTAQQALNAIRRLAQEKQIDLVLEEPTTPISLSHDSHWLAEAISNLVKNAIDHSPPGSAVTISWERTPVFTRLRVKDQGRGIEEKHLPHIFKKFYRASNEGSGVGLGLPLAKLIIERHGGILSAVANRKGGTSFLLTIPHHPFPSSSSKLTKL